MTSPVVITETSEGYTLVQYEAHAWILDGKGWGEGTNPGPLIADVWFYMVKGNGIMPAKWERYAL